MNNNDQQVDRWLENLADAFAVAARDAQANDRAGQVAQATIEAFKESGYLAAAIPTADGGAGHGLLTVSQVQRKIAEVDGSAALCLGMHQMVCGTEVGSQSWPTALRARVFKAVVEQKTLLNNVAAEPELGSPKGGGRPATVLQPDGDGFHLTGHKVFATAAPVLDGMVVYAAVEDGSGDVARVFVPADREGVRVELTWDALGMRASGSDDIHFDRVRVELSDFLVRHPLGTPASLPQVWFPVLVGSAALGVADAARAEAIHFARSRRPTGYAAPISQLPTVREQFGRIEMTMLAAGALINQCAQQWDTQPEARETLGAMAAAAKCYAVNAAVEVTDRCLRVVGGKALLQSSPLQRHFRDVRSLLINPPIDARAYEALARSVLDA